MTPETEKIEQAITQTTKQAQFKRLMSESECILENVRIDVKNSRDYVKREIGERIDKYYRGKFFKLSKLDRLSLTEDLSNYVMNELYRVLERFQNWFNNTLQESKSEQKRLEQRKEEFELEKEVFHNDSKLKMEEMDHQKEKLNQDRDNLAKDIGNFGRDLKVHMEQKETIAKLESENTTIKEVMAAQTKSIGDYRELVKDLTTKLAEISKSAVEKEVKLPSNINFTNTNKD